MSGTGGRRGNGPVWRTRRWWASHGWVPRILAAVIAIPLTLFILVAVVGGALEACGVGGTDPERPRPTASATVTVSVSASEVPEPTVTVTTTTTATRTEKATPVPAVTVTKSPKTAPATKPDPPRAPAGDPVPEQQPDAYYENCDDARDAGVAPLHPGDPGYSRDLDRDGDGVACEPYYGR